MGRKLVVLALTAGAAYLLATRRRARVAHPAGNGSVEARGQQLRRIVGEARARIRADASG